MKALRKIGVAIVWWITFYAAAYLAGGALHTAINLFQLGWSHAILQ